MSALGQKRTGWPRARTSAKCHQQT